MIRRRAAYILIALAVVSVLGFTFLWLAGGAWAGTTTPQAATGSQAPVGTAFTYQGELLQAGSPANGKFDFRFRLFDDATGGNQIGTTLLRDDVQVTNGRFTVVLDFGANAFTGAARWLEIAVRPGSSTGTYTGLSPRQPIMPVPYALHALSSGGNNNAHDHFGQTWTGAAADGLRVHNTQTTGTTYGLLGLADSPNGYGVLGASTTMTGSGIGVTGLARSIDGIGVWGVATSTMGSTIGVMGGSYSPAGVGVKGYGLYTGTVGTAERYGVYGYASSREGMGVLGVTGPVSWTKYFSPVISAGVVGFGFEHPGPIITYPPLGVLGIGGTYAFPGWGTYGDSVGVKGIGTTAGVEGETYGRIDGGQGYGVRGRTNSPLGAGVVGIGDGTWSWRRWPYGPMAIGVLGETYDEDGAGVYAVSYYTGTKSYGLIATTVNTSTGYAALFKGNVAVRGTLTKQGGAFKIDHPLDPENKYLYHSFVESPDMKNIYDGVVVLDENGEAWVQLPEWFEALNKDFRYQLTAIGASMPGLYIAEEIQDNRFKIAGGLPGKKVSWQVTGIRHDPYAEQNRIPVEVDKPEDERGHYLYPEGYNQPPEKGIDYILVNRWGDHK